MVIRPAIPSNPSVPESGTTVTLKLGLPRYIVPQCCRTKLPSLEVFGSRGDALPSEVHTASSSATRIDIVERSLLPCLTSIRSRVVALRDMVERIAGSRSLLRTEQVAIETGMDM